MICEERTKSLDLNGFRVLHKRLRNLYSAIDYLGASLSEKIISCFDDAASLTIASASLDAIETPTCSASGLDITVDVGTLLVADLTSITADPSDIKTVKVSLVIDDATGDVEALIFEKTTGEYGVLPAGKTLAVDRLKEYTVPAAGTVLTEV